MVEFCFALAATAIVGFPKVRPYVGLLLVILVEQELFAGGTVGNEVGPLVSLGSGWFDAHVFGRVPVDTALALLVIFFCWPTAKGIGQGAAKAVLVALTFWVLLLGYVQGASIVDDFASAQNLIVACAGFVSVWGLANADSPEVRRRFCHILYLAVIVKATLGAFAFALGQGPTPDDSVPIAFYDSVPLIVAAATVAVAAFDTRSNRFLRNLALLAALVLAGVSIRRASLVGAVIVILVCVLASRRLSSFLKFSMGAGIVAVISSVAFPSLLDSAYVSLSKALNGLFGGSSSGSSSDSSTRGHLRDNVAGLDLAREHPFLGVGVRAAPTRDFVVKQGDLLYVHNEFLYAWLHYGVIGLLLLIWLIVFSVVRSLRVFARARVAPPWALFGAAVLIAALPGYWFFPHLLTLDRFALLIGWSLGAVASASFVAADGGDDQESAASIPLKQLVGRR